jgi:RsiW-degrading membrane proteinase PrsW (M82 family)/L-amino acid N-acyltransferase YncA
MSEVTTPPAPPVAPVAPTKTPRKWLGRKGGLLIVAAGAVLWFGLTGFEILVEHTREAPTNSLFIGAFTVASAFIYTMAYRLKPSDKLSVVRLLIAFFGGGILAVTIAEPLDVLTNLLTGGTPTEQSLAAYSLAGVVEELVKIGVVLLMSIGLARKNARNGLFIGGAVGFGFAAFEDVNYNRDVWNVAAGHLQSAFLPELANVLERDIIGIFGHPLYTALLAAAVFAGTRNGRFRLTLRIVLVYLGVAAAHGLYDLTEPLVFRATFSNGASEFAFWAVAVILAVVFALIWRRVSRRANNTAAISVRAATGADLEFLTYTLVAASNWDRDRGVTFDSVKTDPAIWHYLEGWQRPTDFGFIALDGERQVGAGWARFFDAEDAGYGFVDAAIPELTLAVIPDARKRRVGRTILDALIQSARELDLPGLSLSVEDGNGRARKLYLRSGFRVVGRSGNSDTMVLRFAGQSASPVGSGAEASLSSAPPTGSPSQ